MKTHESSSDSSRSTEKQQKAGERTNVNLLRYILDHPHATCRTAAHSLGMSFANVRKLVSEHMDSGLLTVDGYKQTGRRGPWSQILKLPGDIGCTVGIDLEATHVRGLVLDFANNVVEAMRRPVEPSAGPDDVVGMVAEIARCLAEAARLRGLDVCKVGLGLPGPFLDVDRAKVSPVLQSGIAVLEFGPAVESACRVSTLATYNRSCFAIAHHRIHDSGSRGNEIVILNRFGLGVDLVWDGKLYTGASDSAGRLGALPCTVGEGGRLHQDVCTAVSLLRFARSRGDTRPLHELRQDPSDQLMKEWLVEAVPAFAQAIYSAVLLYNPDSVVIEGIFNEFPERIRRRIVRTVKDNVLLVKGMVPEIRFYSGDDLMGARGAAMLARDDVVEQVLTDRLRVSRAGSVSGSS